MKFESRQGPSKQLFRTRCTSGGIDLVKLGALTTGAISYDLVEFSTKSANPNGQNREGKSVFAIAEVGLWFGLFHHGPHHIDATLQKVRTFGWVAVKNGESTGTAPRFGGMELLSRSWRLTLAERLSSTSGTLA
jgi:hypothetical protein